MDAIFNPKRRTFLKVGAATGGGLVIGFYLPGAAGVAEAATGPTKLNAFVKIGADGKVTFVTGTSEMGQGAHNALAMMIAEELEVDFKNVRIEQGGIDPAFANPRYIGFRAVGGFQATGGSSSVRNVGVRVRYAGAAARFMLISAGAEKMKELRSECVAENGYVVHKPSGRKVSYGALANDAARQVAPDDPVLKQPSEFKIIGKATPRHDTPPKVTGKALYGLDVKRPGMLIATVAKCPVFGGKVKSFSADRALKVKGVKKVVQISSGVAVVADGFWAAKKGRDALEITWDEGPVAKVSSPGMYQSWAALAKGPTAAERLKTGDVATALATAAKRVESVYEVPFLAHVCMEPMNATAHFKGDSVEIWAPTQAQSWNAHWVSQLTGVPTSAITVHTTYLGGGFGRRLESDYVLDAVETSRAAGNVPVKVVWTREDDLQHDFYRPASHNVFEAALGADGMPTAWRHRIVGTSILQYFKTFGHFLRKDGMDPTSAQGAGDYFPYDIPNVLVDYVNNNPGVPSGFWRSVGNTQNGFLLESFVDELAHAAGKDPYQYRRQLFSKPHAARLRAVLDLVAEKAGWGKPLPAGVHRGIAAHFAYGSYCAQVAEVSVARDGKVKVHRVVAAIDPGWIVNPATVERQIEGAIFYGLTAALYGDITIKNGRVEQSNFDNYKILRMDEMPKVEVHILQGKGEQGGIGEPGVNPVAPAVTNAIFAATGKRIRKLPIKPEMLRT
ncbi:MAG: xanthine dehydrogenase family protein molybdopterin-binding subunit [Betaproteobacteria bacterium]|nr:xanthine dehydrogenase family protein molybdopterin-binding subunit [Betaproteobacteria bacterium]